MDERWRSEDEPGVRSSLLPRSSQTACHPRYTAVCAGRLSSGGLSFNTSVSHTAHALRLGKHTFGVKYGLKLSLLLAVSPLRSPLFLNNKCGKYHFCPRVTGSAESPHRNLKADLCKRKPTSQPSPALLLSKRLLPR